MAKIKIKNRPSSMMQSLMARTNVTEDKPLLIDEATSKKIDDLVNMTTQDLTLFKSNILNAEVDLACNIGGTLVIFGWAHEDNNPIISVRVNGESTNLKDNLYRYNRPEINAKQHINTDKPLGFLLLLDMSISVTKASITLDTASSQTTLDFELTQELKDNFIFKSYFSEMLELADAQGFDHLYTLMSKFAVPANKETAVRAAVDYCYWMPGGVLFFSGWAFSLDATIASMDVRIANKKYNLYAKATLIPREDLRNGFTEIGTKAKTAGFITCLKTIATECPPTISIKVQSTTKDFFTLEVSPKPMNDRQEFSKIALSYLDIGKDGFKYLLDNHLGETLQVGLKDFDKSEFKIKQQQYGQAPAVPKVTVIVPLYGRIDFVKYQLSQFADDPDFKNNVELLYVLDDPKLEAIFYRYCADHAPLFQVPFKAISYGMNLGYAGANNVGASLATTKHLLLLNSDVMPEAAGWVSTMLKEYTALKDAGALAPKLLYEDHSIQHAGMQFERLEAVEGLWGNTHPGKGMPDTDAVESKPIVVPAVTGACLMLSKALYDEVGGLDEQYYLGDFEDSDLCLKLIELGKHNYYLSNLTLYHLERQSQSLFENNDWKTKVTVYNCWQHSKRWNTLITKLAGEAA